MSDGYFGIDKDGLFYFRCRMAERIRVKGEMINGFEVEEGALLHPAVEDAAAIGVPAAHGEEEVHLYVTLKAGALLTADKLQQHCRQTMAKFRVPAAITILQEMPRTQTGKPEKGRLRELYMQSK
jgi:acyl-CoA synthetase (AMP-forming)/AMP-acid ligase II